MRRVYFKKDSTLKLVEYLGDETKYVPRPHGNQKDPHGDYRRTLPSILRQMEKQTHTKNPMDTYREMTTTKTQPVHTKECLTLGIFTRCVMLLANHVRRRELDKIRFTT